MSVLLLHVSVPVSSGRGSCCRITIERGTWPSTLEKFPHDTQVFIFYTSNKRNTCSRCFHLQFVLLEKEGGTKIHSVLSMISKRDRGLNLLLL